MRAIDRAFAFLFIFITRFRRVRFNSFETIISDYWLSCETNSDDDNRLNRKETAHMCQYKGFRPTGRHWSKQTRGKACQESRSCIPQPPT